MRVCFVSHIWAHGGAQLSLIELIDALTARGVECRVVVPAGREVPSALAARAIPYLTFEYWPWARAAPLPRWERFLKKPLVHLVRAVTLARLIRRWRCDVIVTNTITVCEGALAAGLLRVPHVTHAREFGDRDHGLHFEWGPRLSVRLLSMLSMRVVFNSAALAAHYGGQVPAERARVIYNAVSIPPAALAQHKPERPLDHGLAFSCVLVGWLIWGKGHEDAIRAIAALVRRGVPVRLKIVGGGGPPTYAQSLRELIAALGVAAQVEMVEHTSDPWSFFREAEVALMCSRMEAFGRVTIEAMKLGTPVIGARSGGTPELIRDGFNGFLYTPGDAGDLADKIELLARDPHRTREMGKHASQFARDMFTLDRHGREFLDLLEEVTAERSSRSRGIQRATRDRSRSSSSRPTR
jgi:glycosyltransferase involved in cell wall biosynthesis